MQPETTPDRDLRARLEELAEGLADEIVHAFADVSNLPDWMQVPALGNYMRPLALLAARAVLASDWLREFERKVAERTWRAGYVAGWGDHMRGSSNIRNPHSKEATR